MVHDLFKILDSGAYHFQKEYLKLIQEVVLFNDG